MTTDYYWPIATAKVGKIDLDGKRIERAVRIYCTRSDPRGKGGEWSMQIRAPEGLGFARSKLGKRDYLADVRLSRKDMTALRDAINALLDD